MREISLYCGDCLDVMKQIPNSSVDMIIADPPYNISQVGASLNRSEFKNKKMARRKSVTLDYGDWDRMGRHEFIGFTRKWFYSCADKLKDGGAFISFFSKQDISLLAWIGEEIGIRYRTFFTWVKSNPMPSIYRKNYLSATETVFVGSKGDKGWTFNFTRQEEMHNVWVGPNKSIYGETNHPNEKPIDLLKMFIRVHTNVGETVLDPFMGSGSTGVAALFLQRRFIGIEKEEDYFKMAKERIEKKRCQGIQGELFE
ncbi:MAG: hypothetical protein J6Q22_09835 [Prevotella sp.]|nr:hypothetical protein [Prevotella sp.]